MRHRSEILELAATENPPASEPQNPESATVADSPAAKETAAKPNGAAKLKAAPKVGMWDYLDDDLRNSDATTVTIYRLEPIINKKPTSLVQLGCVALHPAPDGGVVSRQTPFDEQLLDVPIRKREPQIPTDRANNDLGFEVPPFKQGWPRFGHRLAAYQTRAPASCNTSVDALVDVLTAALSAESTCETRKAARPPSRSLLIEAIVSRVIDRLPDLQLETIPTMVHTEG
jgi:hypothetical protein